MCVTLAAITPNFQRIQIGQFNWVWIATSEFKIYHSPSGAELKRKTHALSLIPQTSLDKLTTSETNISKGTPSHNEKWWKMQRDTEGMKII